MVWPRAACAAAVSLLCLQASAAPCTAGTACTAGWSYAGPSTYYMDDDKLRITSAGATQDVKAGPNNTWLIGTVNGGVWRTRDLAAAKPKWENVLDGQPVTCSAIAALHVSAHDPRVVYAGCGGSSSSEQGTSWNVVNSGDWAGVMKSTDGGDTWAMLDAFPVNYYVTAILERAPGDLLVAAQSHLYDENDGKIWRSTDGGRSFVEVSQLPTFTLTALSGTTVLATHPRVPRRSISISDDGVTWKDTELPWPLGYQPFYTCATTVGRDTVVVAALTVSTTNSSKTNSSFFVQRGGGRWTPLGQPTSMDEDAMPKDRMAVLGDPDVPDLMYVAGNAGALAWRVNLTTGAWAKLWDDDVTDGSLPHGDCRNFAWDARTGRLLLVTDGGIFARTLPRQRGGRWVSLNGDIQQMELLSAHYDNRGGRFVAGAQDNSAQVWNGRPDEVAIGFVGGDGTVTQVDSVHNPSRLYGTTQFLGVGTIDIDPEEAAAKRLKDDDDDCILCFVQGDLYINVPVKKYYPEPSNFPYFVHPYALNAQDPSKLLFWTNGTAGRPSALVQFHIPANVTDPDDIPAPQPLVATPPGAFFLDLVYGGYTDGAPDPTLVVGMNSSHLYVAQRGGPLRERPLPTRLATPVTLNYAEGTGARILGPVTHGRTVSLSVSPSDSNVIAVTGWGSVASYEGAEEVFLTRDAGVTWTNLTGNLKAATGVVGKVRPGGILVVDLLENRDRAVLLSTANGVMVTFLASTPGTWKRLGTCAEFPIVLTAALSYEPRSDTLVAATFGRGAYALRGAKAALLAARSCVDPSLPAPVPEASSARFFPPQH